MKQTIFWFMMTFISISGFAQTDDFIKGTEKPLYSENKDSNVCAVYGKLLVKTNPVKENGIDIHRIQVFARNDSVSPKENCRTAGEPVFSYDRKEEINLIENSLLGNLLLVNLTLTPDAQVLLIFDLLTRKKVFEKEHTEWRSGMQLQASRYLSYEQWTRKKGLAKNCSHGKKWQKEGLGVDWVQPYRLDLKTMKAVQFGASHCVSTY